MYALMMPITVTIDDRLPFYKGTNTLMYAQAGRDQSLWVPLFEKAVSKFYGSYEALANVGYYQTPINNDIWGAPGYSLFHDIYSEVDLWNRISGTGPTCIVTCWNEKSTYGGLMPWHVFTIIKTHQLSNGTRLVQLRNPFAWEWYQGPWSDESSEWTEQFKQEVGHTKANDGTFFMPFNKFKTEFDSTTVNNDMSQWKGRADWLKLNDNTNNPGRNKRCGKKCTRHEFTLTSSVD